MEAKKLMADLSTSTGREEGRKVDDASGHSSDSERTISIRSSSSREKGSSSSSMAAFPSSSSDEEAVSRGQRIWQAREKSATATRTKSSSIDLEPDPRHKQRKRSQRPYPTEARIQKYGRKEGERTLCRSNSYRPCPTPR